LKFVEKAEDLLDFVKDWLPMGSNPLLALTSRELKTSHNGVPSRGDHHDPDLP
jgi:hypothetical protein